MICLEAPAAVWASVYRCIVAAEKRLGGEFVSKGDGDS